MSDRTASAAAYLRNRDMWIRAVIESPDISHVAARVGVHLAMRINAGNQSAWPAIKTIAQVTGVSVRGVIASLALLEENRFLYCDRKRNRGNRYWLRFIWDE